jgi:excisionase family DNA binding protein
MSDQDMNLLTVGGLAEQLKVKPSWVYGETRKTGPGTIPRIKVGKYLRFSLEEVMDWLKASQNNN